MEILFLTWMKQSTVIDLMDPLSEWNKLQSRRQFFKSSGLSMGGLGLASLLGNESARATNSDSRMNSPLPGLPHFAPRAKAVIYLHMNGGPSQLDTWDYKPNLADWFDKDLPPSVQGGQRLTGMTSKQTRFPIAPSLFTFSKHGQCERWASELVRHTALHSDDIALVKTVHTNAINHDPACTFVMTGREVPRLCKSRLLAQLRLGKRKREPSRFCRPHSLLEVYGCGAGFVYQNVEQRLPAGPL